MLLRIILLILISSPIYAQSSLRSVERGYRVIYVKGAIEDMTAQVALQRGMDIKLNNKINFKSSNAQAVVISPNRGRFVLRKSQSQQSEVYAFVKDVLNPLKKNAALSTRAINTPKVIEDMNRYFGNEDFYVIGNELTFALDPAKYPMSANKLFLSRVEYQGKPVQKMMDFAGTSLILKKDKVYTTRSGDPIPADSIKKVAIYRFVKNPPSADKVAEFNAIFIDEEELKAAYQDLFKDADTENMSDDEKENYFIGFFHNFYGRTDENALISWLKANFDY